MERDTTSPPRKSSPIRLILHWLGCFVMYLGATILLGGILGAFLYLSIGSLTHPDLSISYRLAKGFLNGCRYAGIWAGGLAIVLCVMRGWKQGSR